MSWTLWAKTVSNHVYHVYELSILPSHFQYHPLFPCFSFFATLLRFYPIGKSSIFHQQQKGYANSPDTLSNSRVGLLGLNTDLLEYDALCVGGATEWR